MEKRKERMPTPRHYNGIRSAQRVRARRNGIASRRLHGDDRQLSTRVVQSPSTGFRRRLARDCSSCLKRPNTTSSTARVRMTTGVRCGSSADPAPQAAKRSSSGFYTRADDGGAPRQPPMSRHSKKWGSDPEGRSVSAVSRARSAPRSTTHHQRCRGPPPGSAITVASATDRVSSSTSWPRKSRVDRTGVDGAMQVRSHLSPD